MSEPIITSLRQRNLHKKPETLASADHTRKLNAFRASRGEEVTDPAFPDPRDPDALIQNYIQGLDAMLHSKHPEALPKKLANLKARLHAQCVISPNPANFKGYFASQAQQARDLGVQYQEPTETDKNQRIHSIITEQKNSLDVWVDYLASDESHYSPEQKYLALSSVLKMGVYNPDAHTFSTRYKKTYKPFPDLNSEALGTTLTAMAKGEADDFADTYGQALHDVLKQQAAVQEQREQTRGEWRLYSQGSDYQQLMTDTASQGSGWCFATNAYDAQQYTQHGDQWIYFTPGTDGTFTVPRIGISVRNGQIFEARGVAKGQAMEGEMAEIAQQKLKEFPGHQQYERRTKDTQQLAAIDRKVKDQAPLTKADLTFLYEVDDPVTTFGRGKDARITECLAGRDQQADMLVIFECTADQIAHTQAEVTPDTKAYIGSLVHTDAQGKIIPIFQLIGHLEHIYTQFPDKKIRRTQIEIGGKDKTQLQTELTQNNVEVTPWAKDMMGKAEFTTSPDGQAIMLLRFTIADLGFPNGCTTTQLFARRKELGLEFCPAAVGPYYRLQYLDQPEGEYLSIGMEPITGSRRRPSVFYVSHDGGKLELSTNFAHPDLEWDPGLKFVFRLSKVRSDT